MRGYHMEGQLDRPPPSMPAQTKAILLSQSCHYSSEASGGIDTPSSSMSQVHLIVYLKFTHNAELGARVLGPLTVHSGRDGHGKLWAPPSDNKLRGREKWKWKWNRSVVRLFAIPWIVAYQSPQSMEFSRQEYWSGLPFPSPGDLPNPGIEPWSLAMQADALPSEPPGKPRSEERCPKITAKVQTFHG